MLATVFAALPPALEALLAVVGVFAAVLTIVPALVGFVGLAQHKKLDSIRDDTTYALYASVPAAFGGGGVSAIVALIVLGGPLSFYGNEYLKSHGHVTGDSADTPHAHT